MRENKSILIVDDIEENIDILERQLMTAGYKALTANEAPKALHMLNNKSIDLILLDINMPVVDGITFLESIKKDNLLSQIPVIMVTANDDPKMALACLKKGASGYITKPYSMKQIKQQIDHCFE